MSLRQTRQRLGAFPISQMAEVGFAILAIYVLTNASMWWWIGSPSTAYKDPLHDVGNAEDYIVTGGIYLVALLLSLRRPRALWRAITADPLLIAILALTLLSAAWSDAAGITFRRGAALLGTSVFGVYLHLRYSTENQLRLVGWALGLAVVLSLLQFQPSTLSQGEFRGVFENKNSLGRMMALAILVFGLLAWNRRRRVTAVLFAVFCVVLLLLSNSVTGLIVLLTIVSAIPFLRRMAQDMRLLIIASSIGILVLGSAVLLGTSHLEVVASLFGRDLTLTGRTDLWRYVTEMILRRPWLGYGYETFWLWALPFRLPVDEGAGWVAPNAHNGFLEVALALGLLGLLIFVASLIRGGVRAVNWLRGQPGAVGMWPLTYLCFLLLYNITETVALTRNNLCWVLYVTTLLAVAPGQHQAVRQSKPTPRRRGMRSGASIRQTVTGGRAAPRAASTLLGGRKTLLDPPG
jgi:exopolysaccharide production protein ExoQ